MQLIDYCSIIGDFSRQVLRENVIYNFSESIHRVVSIDVLGNGTRMACKQLDDALVNAGFCQFRDVGGSTLVSNVILQADRFPSLARKPYWISRTVGFSYRL